MAVESNKFAQVAWTYRHLLGYKPGEADCMVSRWGWMPDGWLSVSELDSPYGWQDDQAWPPGLYGPGR